MSVDKSAAFSEIMSHGIDIRNRRIYFGLWGDGVEEDGSAGEFSWTSVDQAIRGLHILSTANPKKPIELHMSSYGGDSYAMLRLVDEILSCPCQVKFIGGGGICSAATWVMAVCDERWVQPNSLIMLHDGSDAFDGAFTDTQIAAKASKHLRERLYQVFAENSHMPVEFWQDVLQRDLHLTAEEAITLGIADKVVEPKKRGNLRRMRIAHMSRNVDQEKMHNLVDNIYARIDRKLVSSIVINVPKKEKFDSNITVDELSVDNNEFIEPLMKATTEGTTGNKE